MVNSRLSDSIICSTISQQATVNREGKVKWPKTSQENLYTAAITPNKKTYHTILRALSCSPSSNLSTLNFNVLTEIKGLEIKHTHIDLTIESNDQVIVNQLNCNYSPIKGHATEGRTRTILHTITGHCMGSTNTYAPSTNHALRRAQTAKNLKKQLNTS